MVEVTEADAGAAMADTAEAAEEVTVAAAAKATVAAILSSDQLMR